MDVSETHNRTTPTSPSFHSNSFGRLKSAAAHNHLAFVIRHQHFFNTSFETMSCSFQSSGALLGLHQRNENYKLSSVDCSQSTTSNRVTRLVWIFLLPHLEAFLPTGCCRCVNHKRSPTRSGGHHMRVFCQLHTNDTKAPSPHTKDVSFRIHVRTFEVTPKLVQSESGSFLTYRSSWSKLIKSV